MEVNCITYKFQIICYWILDHSSQVFMTNQNHESSYSTHAKSETDILYQITEILQWWLTIRTTKFPKIAELIAFQK